MEITQNALCNVDINQTIVDDTSLAAACEAAIKLDLKFYTA